MTVAPHSIATDDSLAMAHRRMRELKTRHLPVLRGTTLKGIISERDVALAEAFGLDPNEVSVEEAMSAEPYTVSPHAPLSRVARAMAAHKYGCAVVTEGSELRGIFTTTDALRALAEVLDEHVAPQPEAMAPSQVLEVMHTEHVNIAQLLERAEDQAQGVLSGEHYGDREVHALRDAARQLYTGLTAHIELENRVLAPALKETDAWGPLRAEQLIQSHAEQKRVLEGALMELDDLAQPAESLAVHVKAVVELIRQDLAYEEQALLCPELLRDDPIVENAETD
jgi:acetoin utilization protein AcuB